MTTLLKAWRRYRRTRGLSHELVTLLLCLGAGVVAMPLLIWVVGSQTLGAYANGGPLNLWRDFFMALGTGSRAYWLVALGPYGAVWAWRLLRSVR